MRKEDEWLTMALYDDDVVVELLLRLKQSAVPHNLAWGCRQPRSNAVAVRKERESMMRCSPTTPLSWSCCGGASSSPSDDSSRPSDLLSAARSKRTYDNDSKTGATINKRSRREKSFFELQEDSVLVKERVYLKKDGLATLHETLKEQNATTAKSKRLKLDLHQQTPVKRDGKSEYLEALSASNRIIYQDDNVAQTVSLKVSKEIETRERSFIIPDLNMLPSEGDSGFQGLNGFS